MIPRWAALPASIDVSHQNKPAPGLSCGATWLDLSEPRVMGVLNVTPDSFSDGGALGAAGGDEAAGFFVSVDKALALAARMQQDGAAIVDIGGESTRPGAKPVSEQQELDRVIPVVEAITRRLDIIVSVDTSSPLVIAESGRAGAGMINDIRALRRVGALDAVAATGMAACLMHMQGEPGTMQQQPEYTDLVTEVVAFLAERVQACEVAGIGRHRLCLDPGFGFGKTPAHNYRLLRHIGRFCETGLPVLAGMSRKSMIAAATGRPVTQRLAGSLAAAILAVQGGAAIVRVHDVAETVDVLKVLQAARELSTSGSLG